MHAVAAKRITGAPLCTWLMDDQNIYAPHVPDQRVAELLAASDLRLAISPEMCAAYRAKFGGEMHLLPPVLTRRAAPVPCYWEPEGGAPPRCAMIGNVWTAQSFQQLRAVLRESGVQVDWYGNGANAAWLPDTPEDWERDNLFCLGMLPEEDLVASLASYPFILVPSGTLEADDDNPAFSRLSLPSRLLFLHATTDTPVLVLGSSETAAGRFVTRLGTGICVTTSPEQFRAAARQVEDASVRDRLRQNIRRWANSLIMENAGQWLWDSLAARRPRPAPFHPVFEGGSPAPVDARPMHPPLPAIAPASGEPFRDEHARYFAFVRQRHLPMIFDPPPPDPEQIESGTLAQHMVRLILQRALPSKTEVLYLGPDLPPSLATLSTGLRFWRIHDLPQWQRAGYSGDPAHLVPPAPDERRPTELKQFDAIASTGWCGTLPDDHHALEGLSLYLAACTREGGWNVHAFHGVLHPAYFWTHPCHRYFGRRFLAGKNWPGIDEILAADDVFFIGAPAFAREWQPAVGRTYEAFGRPLALVQSWRQAPES